MHRKSSVHLPDKAVAAAAGENRTKEGDENKRKRNPRARPPAHHPALIWSRCREKPGRARAKGREEAGGKREKNSNESIRNDKEITRVLSVRCAECAFCGSVLSFALFLSLSLSHSCRLSLFQALPICLCQSSGSLILSTN